MSDNILVTGANGFVGSHMVHYLCKQKGVNLVVAMIRDQRPDYWTIGALSNAVNVFLDLNDHNATEKLKRALSYYDITKVYHFASQAIVSRAEKNPIDTYMTNVMGAAKLFEAARQIGGIKILHMSTDKVYGEGHQTSTKNPLFSTEPYSSSKICAEYVAHDYRRHFDMNIAIARPCNIIGYDPYNTTRIVPATIFKLLSGEKPIVHDGQSSRQYLYVEDAVKILRMCIGGNQTYNIGSPFILNPIEFIKKICNAMGVEPIYEERSAPFREILQQSMDYDHDFSYTPIDTALKEIIDKYQRFFWGDS